MILKLPHRKVSLDVGLSIEKRKQVVENILQEQIEFYNQQMTVEEYFRKTWYKSPTKTCLDIIGYYLTKDNTSTEDKEILSNHKQKEMEKGSKRHVTFSGLSKKNAVRLGISDFDDSDYN